MKLDISISRTECANNKYMNLITREALRNALVQFLDVDITNVSSCTSAVIDAKIERAMDMSHSLIYAMQEEVEVLNKQIVVLVDRIKQLEVENAFLKSNASPDVLRALSNGAAAPAAILPNTCCGEYDKETLQKEDLEVAAITANGSFGLHY